jgi:Cytochrome c
MPAFLKLSDAEVDAIAVYVMTLKGPSPSTVATTANYGDGKAGFQYFTHEGGCNRCHSIQGRGGVIGPDLGAVGRTRTTAQIEQALLNPGSLPQTAAGGRRRGSGGESAGPSEAPASYTAATVKLRDGRTIRGALKSETTFDVQLMGLDGHLYLHSRDQVAEIVREPHSLMPKVQASAEAVKNLVAYLSLLKGENTDASTPLPPNQRRLFVRSRLSTPDRQNEHRAAARTTPSAR